MCVYIYIYIYTCIYTRHTDISDLLWTSVLRGSSSLISKLTGVGGSNIQYRGPPAFFRGSMGSLESDFTVGPCQKLRLPHALETLSGLGFMGL